MESICSRTPEPLGVRLYLPAAFCNYPSLTLSPHLHEHRLTGTISSLSCPDNILSLPAERVFPYQLVCYEVPHPMLQTKVRPVRIARGEQVLVLFKPARWEIRERESIKGSQTHEEWFGGRVAKWGEQLTGLALGFGVPLDFCSWRRLENGTGAWIPSLGLCSCM